MNVNSKDVIATLLKQNVVFNIGWIGPIRQSNTAKVWYFKILFMGKSDIICVRCKPKVCNFPKNSMDVNYNNLRGLFVLDPETKDMYHCHPYHVLEIYKSSVNKHIGSYQIQHLES